MGGLPTVTLRHCSRRKWLKRPVASPLPSNRSAQGAEFAKCELFPTAAIRVECGESQVRAHCAYVRYPTSHEVTSEQIAYEIL